MWSLYNVCAYMYTFLTLPLNYVHLFKPGPSVHCLLISDPTSLSILQLIYLSWVLTVCFFSRLSLPSLSASVSLCLCLCLLHVEHCFSLLLYLISIFRTKRETTGCEWSTTCSYTSINTCSVPHLAEKFHSSVVYCRPYKNNIIRNRCPYIMIIIMQKDSRQW